MVAVRARLPADVTGVLRHDFVSCGENAPRLTAHVRHFSDDAEHLHIICGLLALNAWNSEQPDFSYFGAVH